MPGPNFVLDKGFLVDEDSTGIGQFRTVRFRTVADSTVDVASTAGEVCIGVAQEEIEGADAGKRVANVRMLGITRCILGDTLTAGTVVASTNDGRVDEVAVDQHVVGILLTGGDTGDQAELFLTPSGVIYDPT